MAWYPKKDMDPEATIFFRDQFRQARAAALQDAEGFQEILFALERLGSYLSGKTMTLDPYQKFIEALAKNSPLAEDISQEHPAYHSKFSTVYELARDARNDALHQGAFARHLTDHAIELALVLEDALMSDANSAAEFMVRDPVSAALWQPISFIRQQMLKNSFTYLPLWAEYKGVLGWWLVSDYHIAQYLRKALSKEDRKARLATRIQDAMDKELKPDTVEICFIDTGVQEILEKCQAKPVLVVDKEHPEQLIGIITPFDLL
jgi:hypothetical protein